MATPAAFWRLAVDSRDHAAVRELLQRLLAAPPPVCFQGAVQAILLLAEGIVQGRCALACRDALREFFDGVSSGSIQDYSPLPPSLDVAITPEATAGPPCSMARGLCAVLAIMAGSERLVPHAHAAWCDMDAPRLVRRPEAPLALLPGALVALEAVAGDAGGTAAWRRLVGAELWSRDIKTIGAGCWLQSLLDIGDGSWPVQDLPSRLHHDLKCICKSGQLGAVLHISVEGMAAAAAVDGDASKQGYYWGAAVRVILKAVHKLCNDERLEGTMDDVDTELWERLTDAPSLLPPLMAAFFPPPDPQGGSQPDVLKRLSGSDLLLLLKLCQADKTSKAADTAALVIEQYSGSHLKPLLAKLLCKSPDFADLLWKNAISLQTSRGPSFVGNMVMTVLFDCCLQDAQYWNMAGNIVDRLIVWLATADGVPDTSSVGTWEGWQQLLQIVHGHLPEGAHRLGASPATPLLDAIVCNAERIFKTMAPHRRIELLASLSPLCHSSLHFAISILKIAIDTCCTDAQPGTSDCSPSILRSLPEVPSAGQADKFVNLVNSHFGQIETREDHTNGEANLSEKAQGSINRAILDGLLCNVLWSVGELVPEQYIAVSRVTEAMLAMDASVKGMVYRTVSSHCLQAGAGQPCNPATVQMALQALCDHVGDYVIIQSDANHEIDLMLDKCFQTGGDGQVHVCDPLPALFSCILAFVAAGPQLRVDCLDSLQLLRLVLGWALVKAARCGAVHASEDGELWQAKAAFLLQAIEVYLNELSMAPHVASLLWQALVTEGLGVTQQQGSAGGPPRSFAQQLGDLVPWHPDIPLSQSLPCGHKMLCLVLMKAHHKVAQHIEVAHRLEARRAPAYTATLVPLTELGCSSSKEISMHAFVALQMIVLDALQQSGGQPCFKLQDMSDAVFGLHKALLSNLDSLPDDPDSIDHLQRALHQSASMRSLCGTTSDPKVQVLFLRLFSAIVRGLVQRLSPKGARHVVEPVLGSMFPREERARAAEWFSANCLNCPKYHSAVLGDPGFPIASAALFLMVQGHMCCSPQSGSNVSKQRSVWAVSISMLAAMMPFLELEGGFGPNGRCLPLGLVWQLALSLLSLEEFAALAPPYKKATVLAVAMHIATDWEGPLLALLVLEGKRQPTWPALQRWCKENSLDATGHLAGAASQHWSWFSIVTGIEKGLLSRRKQTTATALFALCTCCYGWKALMAELSGEHTNTIMGIFADVLITGLEVSRKVCRATESHLAGRRPLGTGSPKRLQFPKQCAAVAVAFRTACSHFLSTTGTSPWGDSWAGICKASTKLAAAVDSLITRCGGTNDQRAIQPLNSNCSDASCRQGLEAILEMAEAVLAVLQEAWDPAPVGPGVQASPLSDPQAQISALEAEDTAGWQCEEAAGGMEGPPGAHRLDPGAQLFFPVVPGVQPPSEPWSQISTPGDSCFRDLQRRTHVPGEDRESDEGEGNASDDDFEPYVNLAETLDHQDLEQGQSDSDGCASLHAAGQSNAFIAGMPPEETENADWDDLAGFIVPSKGKDYKAILEQPKYRYAGDRNQNKRRQSDWRIEGRRALSQFRATRPRTCK